MGSISFRTIYVLDIYGTTFVIELGKQLNVSIMPGDGFKWFDVGDILLMQSWVNWMAEQLRQRRQTYYNLSAYFTLLPLLEIQIVGNRIIRLAICDKQYTKCQNNIEVSIRRPLQLVIKGLAMVLRGSQLIMGKGVHTPSKIGHVLKDLGGKSANFDRWRMSPPSRIIPADADQELPGWQWLITAIFWYDLMLNGCLKHCSSCW